MPFEVLKDVLGKEHTITPTELTSGQAPEESDILLVLAPEAMSDKQVFAIDQFLMRGGTVVIAAAPYAIGLDRDLNVEKKPTGLEPWLEHLGVRIEEEMVLDPRNTPFPVPVQRQVAGFTVQETRLVNYPYFVDIRADGMNRDSGLLTGLNQLTMNWASPITVDTKKNKERKVMRLLESSEKSWTSAEIRVQPDFKAHGEMGFAAGDTTGRKLLGVAVEGQFTSYFSGKESPLMLAGDESEQPPAPGQPPEEQKKRVIVKQLDKSPESARIILFSSGTFLSDSLLGIGSTVNRTAYLAPVQLIANSVDWSLEDRGLLSIRGRSHFSRPLLPMDRDLQVIFEYLNYGLAFFGLFLVWLVRRRLVRRRERRHMALLQQSLGRM
jgi:ABC-2 type transport system permease protein